MHNQGCPSPGKIILVPNRLLVVGQPVEICQIPGRTRHSHYARPQPEQTHDQKTPSRQGPMHTRGLPGTRWKQQNPTPDPPHKNPNLVGQCAHRISKQSCSLAKPNLHYPLATSLCTPIYHLHTHTMQLNYGSLFQRRPTGGRLHEVLPMGYPTGTI